MCRSRCRAPSAGMMDTRLGGGSLRSTNQPLRTGRWVFLPRSPFSRQQPPKVGWMSWPIWGQDRDLCHSTTNERLPEQIFSRPSYPACTDVCPAALAAEFHSDQQQLLPREGPDRAIPPEYTLVVSRIWCFRGDPDGGGCRFSRR